jgi:hypothetical protein
MKQTAVEWQFEQMFNSFEKFNNRECTFNDYLKRNLEIREQAKEMEKEQRKKCFFDGKLMCINNKDISFEDYELGNFNNPRVHFATKQQEQ